MIQNTYCLIKFSRQSLRAKELQIVVLTLHL